MSSLFKKYPSIIWKAFVILSLAFFLIIVAILKTNQDIAEWWSRNIARFYVTVSGSISKYVPFSLMELFFISTIGYIIFLIILLIKDFINKRRYPAISKLATIPMIILSIIANYSFACSFNYQRKEVDLPFYKEEVDNSEFDEIYNYFIDDLNYCISKLSFGESGDVIIKDSVNKLSRTVGESFKILDSDYYNSINAYAKPMVSSFLYRELQITGVSFSSFGEANVNYLSTNVELPFTIAHELAHIKGVMREDDANQVAFYVCLNSNNPLLRFSSYCLYFYQIRKLSQNNLMTKEQLSSLNKYDNNYAIAVNNMIDYWKKHDLLGKIGDFFNDLSIKSNGVKEGSDSYQGGTEQTIVPGTGKLIPSKYQLLFFEKYFRLNK